MSLLQQLITTKNKPSKRVGRGIGSGKGGHTSGRGQKGQRSRGGSKIPLWFEGGQLPIIKRLPMLRGKNRLKSVRPTAEVTLSEIQKMATDVISLETLKSEKVIDRRFKKAKIIATGKLDRKVTVQGVTLTARAKTTIENLGGIIE